MSTLNPASEPFQPTLAFYFAPWYRRRQVLESPLTPEQCRERLGASVISRRDARSLKDVSGPPDGHAFVGLLRDASFAVSRHIPGRTTAGPMVLGRLEAAGSGTRVMLSVVPSAGSAYTGWWLMYVAAVSAIALAVAHFPSHPLGTLDPMMTLGMAFGVALAPIGLGLLGVERRGGRLDMAALPDDIGRLLEARSGELE